MDYPLDCYKDDPKSIGAAVQFACDLCGIFRGFRAQRSELLATAQGHHRRVNGGKTNPEHETLGRELRHRNPKRISPDITRQRMHFADRALVQGWRIVCEKGRVWAVRV